MIINSIKNRFDACDLWKRRDLGANLVGVALFLRE